jgi:hypothetical protein
MSDADAAHNLIVLRCVVTPQATSPHRPPGVAFDPPAITLPAAALRCTTGHVTPS